MKFNALDIGQAFKIKFDKACTISFIKDVFLRHMLKLFYLLPFLVLSMIPSVFAQTELIVENSLTDDIFDDPDSPLWGLDVALDKIQMLLARDDLEKTRIGLEVAEERLVEVKKMIIENKLKHAEKA